MLCRLLLWVLCLLLSLPRNGGAARTPGYARFGAEEGLASGEVLALQEDQEGYLWAATFASGVHRFDGQHFKRYGAAEGLTSQRVKRLYVDRRGRVYAATLAGLFFFADERFHRDATLGDVAIYDVLEATNGDWWFATSKGAIRRSPDGTLRTLAPIDGLPAENATAVAECAGGALWIGTIQGLALFQGGALQRFTRARGDLRDDYITRLRCDGSGVLWVATDRGLQRQDGTRFARVDLGVGAQRLYVLDLLFLDQDEPGTLRVATLGAGVLSIDRAGARRAQLSTVQGLPSANIWSLAQSRGGGLWIGTEAHGIALREAGPFRPMLALERLQGAVPVSLARDRAGHLWVGTNGAGVLRDPEVSGDALTTKQGLPSDFVRELLATDHGLWIGTAVGLAFWDGQALTALDPRREPFPVRDLLPAEDGGVWLVNKEEGLVRYHRTGAGRPRGFRGERFPTSADATPASLWSLARDGRGHLWLGATSALYRYDGQAFTRWPVAGLSATDRIMQLVADGSQRLWFRSDEAVGTVSLTEAGAGTVMTWPLPRTAWLRPAAGGAVLVAAEDGLYRLRIAAEGLKVEAQSGEAEGYPRSATNAGGVLAAPDGVLLFGTADGLFRFDPAHARGPSAARVHLRGLRLARGPAPLPDAAHPLRLAHDQNQLTVDFDATAFPAPETVEFRYRLDGLSESWSPPTSARSATFLTLPPGRYALRLQARHGGPWNGEILSGPIEISPAFWQRLWFWLLLCAAALALAVSIPVLRARALLARAAERSRITAALETERRAAALGRLAAVVAHQVNTPLAAIKARLALLREDVGADEARAAEGSLSVIDRQVDRIATITRGLLGFVRLRDAGARNPDLRLVVRSVAELYGEVLRARGIQLVLALPEEPVAVSGQLDDLQELLLNLVENSREAVASGGEVRITLSRHDDFAELLVEDDGPGLGADPEQLFQPFYTTKTTGTGLGLAIARRIAEGPGGTLRGENRFPDGRGARFVLRLPAEDRRGHASHPDR